MNLILDLVGIGAVISAIFTVSTINPVNSVIGLISVYVHIAIYLIILTLTFIGLSYLIIYVGAIAILFLFVVMMMNIKYIELSEIGKEYTQNLPLGAIIGTLFILELLSSTLMPLNKNLTNLTISPNLKFGYLWQNSEFNWKTNPTNFETGVESKITTTISNLNESIYINSSSIAYGNFWDSIFYSFSHIEGLGYTLYTYGLLWFIIGAIILLLAMIAPIVLTYDGEQKLHM